ncbi:MAG: hypothetical protein QW364_01885 [Thermoplasmatales archaeon]
MILREGSASIEVLSYFETGPGRRSPGFFNREMEISRDLTVAVLSAFPRGRAIDPMAGTGVRGIRIYKEAGWEIAMNDINRENSLLCRKNAEMNGVSSDIFNEDYFSAISRGTWDYIDIDPFGSPAGYIDAALMRLRNHGIIGATMTDTQNLEGTSIKKGERIYLARGIRGTFAREVSTRIFISYLLRKGASLGFGGQPLAAVREGHYIRAFIRYTRGSSLSSKTLEEIGEIEVEGQKVGPLYTGRIYDRAVIEKIGTLRFSERTNRFFNNFPYEDLMILFFLNRSSGREVKKSAVIDRLRAAGFYAGPTNFNEKGIKSNAPKEIYEGIISTL